MYELTLKPLLLGTGLVVVNLALLIYSVTLMMRYLESLAGTLSDEPSVRSITKVLAVVLSVLFVGHIMQFATWALLFMFIGEFDRFSTALYHSGVNFTSLGYGDIVMSERWRLLGPLEAANGVLMFGVSAGILLPVMRGLFGRSSQFFLLTRETNRQD